MFVSYLYRDRLCWCLYLTYIEIGSVDVCITEVAGSHHTQETLYRQHSHPNYTSGSWNMKNIVNGAEKFCWWIDISAQLSLCIGDQIKPKIARIFSSIYSLYVECKYISGIELKWACNVSNCSPFPHRKKQPCICNH